MTDHLDYAARFLKELLNEEMIKAGHPDLPEVWGLVAGKMFEELEAREFVVIRRPVVGADMMAPTCPPARHNDPATSHLAAAWRPRRGAMCFRMLMAHGEAYFGPAVYRGFTADEIARAIGLLPNSRGCLWHRHGDLEEKGCLQTLYVNGELITRTGETGDEQKVRVLTPHGVALYQEIERGHTS